MKGHVFCLDKRTGKEIRKTHLKSGGLTNLVIQDDFICPPPRGGELFASKMTDGTILWDNPLTGMDYGHCIFASASQHAVIAMAQSDQEQAAASSGAA